MHELPPDLHERIRVFCSEGDALVSKGAHREAIEQYNQAYKLIPEPKQEWEASTWVLAAIGDVCFASGYFTSGQKALAFAMQCPKGIGNPFLHLRLGQCEFELGHKDQAADELARAYMGAGAEIFEREDEKYFVFVKSQLKPPAGLTW
jgi:tetratricopeptide (TPR) repeat protein